MQGRTHHGGTESLTGQHQFTSYQDSVDLGTEDS